MVRFTSKPWIWTHKSSSKDRESQQEGKFSSRFEVFLFFLSCILYYYYASGLIARDRSICATNAKPSRHAPKPDEPLFLEGQLAGDALHNPHLMCIDESAPLFSHLAPFPTPRNTMHNWSVMHNQHKTSASGAGRMTQTEDF